MQPQGSFWEVFLIFLRLGFTSFGGPIAHLGYFYQEFVIRRKWIQDKVYADLVALCQFLPGPASSQVGIAIGLIRGGLPGAFAAWLGFTIPSALMLVIFGLWFANLRTDFQISWINGLKIFAVAVVAQAVLAMVNNLGQDISRRIIVLIAAAGVIVLPGFFGQIVVMLAGGIWGVFSIKSQQKFSDSEENMALHIDKFKGFLVFFILLLVVLPVLATFSDLYVIKLFDCFYRTGALVFGGGHVVLPLLQSQVVLSDWVNADVFLAGYGAAQIVPGPMFTFAAYLGAVSLQSPSGWLGALIALVAIFLPAFLLIVGVLPYWDHVRRSKYMMSIMPGINSSVVGILLAAWYDPVISSAIHTWADVCLAASALILLVFLRWPYWLVAFGTVLISVLIQN